MLVIFLKEFVWQKRTTMPWQWESAIAGAVAGLTTVVALHPLDIVRTRFQVHDGRDAAFPKYRSTVHALLTISRTEGLKGLYAGLYPALLGSSLSWGLYFFFYNNAKSINRFWSGGELGPGFHLLSAAESGALVCILTNPVWLIKTRLQLQVPGHAACQPYSGFRDAARTILREEGWRALYKGLGPSLLLVSHGSLQFMAYEEGRKAAVWLRSQQMTEQEGRGDGALKPLDYAVLGALSKTFAVAVTYPYQVIRSRIQQRPNIAGVVKYANTWHAFMKILRYEGIPGLYKGIVPNLLKNAPSSSITFLVYETVLKLLT
eukprot:c19834_g1_i1 orf=501-1454(+)